jgi:hypothetical protein
MLDRSETTNLFTETPPDAHTNDAHGQDGQDGQDGQIHLWHASTAGSDPGVTETNNAEQTPPAAALAPEDWGDEAARPWWQRLSELRPRRAASYVPLALLLALFATRELGCGTHTSGRTHVQSTTTPAAAAPVMVTRAVRVTPPVHASPAGHALVKQAPCTVSHTATRVPSTVSPRPAIQRVTVVAPVAFSSPPARPVTVRDQPPGEAPSGEREFTFER